MNIIQSKHVIPGTIGRCFFIPQNGVDNGATLLDSSQIPIGFNPHGDMTSTHISNRPKALDVNTLPSNNGKILRDCSDEVDDGSLPCSPEMQPDTDFPHSSSAGDEVLVNDTRELIITFLTDFVGMTPSRRKESKPMTTMKRVVADLLEKHQYTYNGMLNKLNFDEYGDNMTFVTAVAKSLFADGTTNWGRITSLVAFGAVLCQHLKKLGKDHCVMPVGQEISEYLILHQRDWLVKNNSWDGFVDFFQVADPETTVRNTLIAVAGFAGLGATLAFFIR